MSETPQNIQPLPFRKGLYRTEPRRISLFARALPSVRFYLDMIRTVLRAGRKAKRGEYNDTDWAESSREILDALERVGVRLEITGIENFRALEGPCVFVANHMSTFETFVLPVVIAPFKRVTFVVKESLVKYPVFKHVLISRDPVVVTRENPREDLTRVLRQGTERLKKGISMVIFPQTTRTDGFDPRQFNSIGVKLARRAEVPVIPIALKTDAWGCGRFIKDFGKIDPSKRAFFAFGEPLWIKERGVEEHRMVMDFIKTRLDEWKGEGTLS